jgi:YHS domain-containing protein
MTDMHDHPFRGAALALLAVLPILGACRATSANASPLPGHAQCPVCKCEGDLACVDVKIEADTPHTTVDGKTVYFCSESCCCAFEKDPQAYSR